MTFETLNRQIFSHSNDGKLPVFRAAVEKEGRALLEVSSRRLAPMSRPQGQDRLSGLPLTRHRASAACPPFLSAARVRLAPLYRRLPFREQADSKAPTDLLPDNGQVERMNRTIQDARAALLGKRF